MSTGKACEYQCLFSFTILLTIWACMVIHLHPVIHFCIKLQLEMHVFICAGEEPFVCQFWEAVPSHHFLDYGCFHKRHISECVVCENIY